VQKIANAICNRPLQHRISKYSLEEVDANYGDLILHTEIRWLSRGNVLFKCEELSEIRV
jgi:hypothetical protein